MITLYGMGSPNVRKIVLALHELDLPYEFRHVDVQMGEQFTPEFGKLNPARKVPVLVDDDGPGGKPITIFESGAILIYLAEKTGKLLPTEPVARATTIQWLMFQVASVGPHFGQKAHFWFYAPEGQDYPKKRYGSEMRRLCEVMNERLGETPYLAGDAYSIADIAVWPWISIVNGRGFGVDMTTLPNLQRWFEEIAKRPGTVRAVEAAKGIRGNNIADLKRDHPEKLALFLGQDKPMWGAAE